jgi:hypothetical protein
VLSKRGLFFLVIAVQAHALVLLGIPPPSAMPPPQPPEQPEVETELYVFHAPIEPSVSTVRPSDDEKRSAVRSSETASIATHAKEVAASAGSAGPSAVLEAAPAPSGAASGAAAEGEGWTFQATAPADVTAPGFVAEATRGIGTAELERHGPFTTGGLLEGLDAHDVAVSMGRGGPVLIALENALAADGAPFEGAATFDIGIDTSGHVSVAILDQSVASSGWSRVADAARAAIDPSVVRIPPGARGWHVVARIDATIKYPNGVDPKTLGTKLEASPGSVRVDKDAIVIEKLPAVSFAHSGKVCSVRVDLGLTLTPITGGCDPSNIGTQPLRVVHGHVVSEGRL